MKMPMIPNDDETLEQKVIRLMEAHNNLVVETKQNTAKAQILINNLMYVFENEIEDFAEKYKKADFTTRLEAVITARLNAHLNADLAAYKVFGQRLAVIRKNAKEADKSDEGFSRLSLYNKVVRDAKKSMQVTDFGQYAPAVDPNRITATPALEVVGKSTELGNPE